MENQEKEYQFWIHNLPDVGNVKIRALLNAFGSERAVYQASEAQLGRILDESTARAVRQFTLTWNVQEEYEKLKEKTLNLLPVRIRTILCLSGE